MLIKTKLIFLNKEVDNCYSHIKKYWGIGNCYIGLIKSEIPDIDGRNFYYISKIDSDIELDFDLIDQSLILAESKEDFWRKFYELPLEVYYEVLERIC